MRDAWTIATKDLRRRLRDRTAILVALVLPFGLAYIFSLTLGDIETRSFEATFAVVSLDSGHLPDEFTSLLESLDFVSLRDAATETAAETLASDGDVDAAMIFPQGFTADVQTGRGSAIHVITAPNARIAGLVAESLATSFASNLDATGLSIATVADSGAPVADTLTARAQAVTPGAEIRAAGAEDKSGSQSTFFAIGMAVFFLFFAVEFGVRGVLEEREEGTLSRLLVAPILPSSVIGGKALASFAVGLTSTVLLVIATTWLLEARWGDPLGVALLVLFGVLAAVGVTALVATLAKSTAQASAYVSIVAVVGGLLGGTFFPISQAGFLSTIRFLSPQGWLMEGFQELSYGGSAHDIVRPLSGVLTIALVSGTLAWFRSARLVAR
ncbi:MAG: ABC transporter permease [Actinomycetota bacterium]|nr:ABC transporter permease [Actinomycetota bacterium]MDH5313325.1 ABC transporter permease [Actinomycetota bacterium]